MKKITVPLLILALMTGSVMSLTAQKKELIKRSVTILPMLNQSSNKDVNYLGDVIVDAIKAELAREGTLNIIMNQDVKDKIESLELTPNEYVSNEKKAIDLALQLSSDVVVVGKFATIGDALNITVNCYDILFTRNIINLNVTGTTGVEIFKVINNDVAKILAEKMLEELKPVDKSLLQQLSIDKYVIEEEDEQLIGTLLEQSDKYRKVTVNLRGEKVALAIPKTRSALILVRNNPGSYTVMHDEKEYVSKNGIKILVFNSEVGSTHTLAASIEGGKTTRIDFRQRKDFDVQVMNISFQGDDNRYNFISKKQGFMTGAVISLASGLTVTGAGTALFPGLFIYFRNLYDNSLDPQAAAGYQQNTQLMLYVGIGLIATGGAALITSIVLFALTGSAKKLQKELAGSNRMLRELPVALAGYDGEKILLGLSIKI
jgi:TolB-like protein